MTAFSQEQAIDIFVSIGAAFVLALPLAWERETEGVARVGWRTLPMVSVGTCAYLLISRYLFERGVYEADGTARTLRAMMTGIGFIGGGAILTQATSVKGVTTAACVWTTGAIAASVAHGYYSVALTLSLASLLIVQIGGRLVRPARDAREADRREDQ